LELENIQKGDAVRYRSIGGPTYPATVTGVRPGGFIDLDIEIGGNTPIHLDSVRIERMEKVRA
jgi:hypothetical protein